MKRRYFILATLLIMCFGSGQAQSVPEVDFRVSKEGKLIMIPKFKKYDLNIPKFSYNTYTPSAVQTIRINSRLHDFMPQEWPIGERPMDMQVSSAAYQPFFNVYTPMIRRVSPMAFDFQEYSFTPISPSTGILVEGEQYTWPGAGGLTRVSTSLVWQTDRWSLTGGAFAGRYFTPFNSSPDYMGGINATVSYEATDRITIRGWGQYAFYGKTERLNPHMLLNPFFNHTNVGGAFEFKVKENLKFGVGVNYEYNRWNNKMEPQIFIYPGFNTKGLRIGM